jgi:hypothetical protein
MESPLGATRTWRAASLASLQSACICRLLAARRGVPSKMPKIPTSLAAPSVSLAPPPNMAGIRARMGRGQKRSQSGAMRLAAVNSQVDNDRARENGITPNELIGAGYACTHEAERSESRRWRPSGNDQRDQGRRGQVFVPDSRARALGRPAIGLTTRLVGLERRSTGGRFGIGRAMTSPRTCSPVIWLSCGRADAGAGH